MPNILKLCLDFADDAKMPKHSIKLIDCHFQVEGCVNQLQYDNLGKCRGKMHQLIYIAKQLE